MPIYAAKSRSKADTAAPLMNADESMTSAMSERTWSLIGAWLGIRSRNGTTTSVWGGVVATASG